MSPPRYDRYPQDLTAVPPQYSDDELAMRFAARHEEDFRYVAQRRKWYEWKSPVWKQDPTLNVFDQVRTVCREASNELGNDKTDHAIAQHLTSWRTIASTERMARSDRRLAATPEQFDGYSYLLNTPDGLYDLEKLILLGPLPEAYSTRCTRCVIDFGCQTPLWSRFLDTVTGGDQDLSAYLQRMCGYFLTGSTQEHALFFLHGSGSNGKSVFISTVSGIMSDYARNAPVEVFMENVSSRHPTELMMLNGPRLVTAVETEEGRSWAATRIKSLTGGDKITARLMRQDFDEFTPVFKLLIAGNNKPNLRTVDEAIRRRFNLIPFTIVIPKAERDLELTAKLQAEWPGILAWMIAGCTAWQINGLCPPASVASATESYFHDEDNLAAWMTDRGVREPPAFESDAKLFASWTDWAIRAGEQAGTRKQFVEKLENVGLTKHRQNDARGHLGYRLFYGAPSDG